MQQRNTFGDRTTDIDCIVALSGIEKYQDSIYIHPKTQAVGHGCSTDDFIFAKEAGKAYL